MHLYICIPPPDLVLKQPWRQATFPAAVARDPATPAFDANHFAVSQTRSVHFSTKTQLPIYCLYQLNFFCAPCPFVSLCFLLTKRLLSFFLSLTAGLQAFAARSSSPSGDSFAPTPASVVRPYSPSYLSFFYFIFYLFFDPDTINLPVEDGTESLEVSLVLCVCRCKSVILDTHYPGVVIPLQDPMWKRRRDRI